MWSFEFAAVEVTHQVQIQIVNLTRTVFGGLATLGGHQLRRRHYALTTLRGLFDLRWGLRCN